MTMRERMLAVVQGREHDRVPFVQYDGMVPAAEAWAAVGRENIGLLRWVGATRLDSPHCRFDREDIRDGDLKGCRTTLQTPEGRLVQVKFFTPAFGESAAAAPRKQFITDLEDHRIFQAYLRDLRVYPDPEPLQRAYGELGDDGSVHLAVGRTSWQALWTEWMLEDDLCYHVADAPGTVEETMTLMGWVLREQMRIAAATDAPYVVFPDNITAPMIGPERFRKYCVPYYKEMAALLDGRPVYVHMDGDLKPLWPAIGESAVRGLDSMSPPPDNDTRVADALRLWPQMRVAINFPSSVHLRSPQGIYEVARQVLEEGGRSGRLQIQISENMPPEAWRKSYPAIVRAIEDFR
jgi:hypothetical protein